MSIECLLYSYFQQLNCLWQEPEVSEVLHRLAMKTEELESKTKKLAAASGNCFLRMKKDNHIGGVAHFVCTLYFSFIAFISNNLNHC